MAIRASFGIVLAALPAAVADQMCRAGRPPPPKSRAAAWKDPKDLLRSRLSDDGGRVLAEWQDPEAARKQFSWKLIELKGR